MIASMTKPGSSGLCCVWVSGFVTFLQRLIYPRWCNAALPKLSISRHKAGARLIAGSGRGAVSRVLSVCGMTWCSVDPLGFPKVFDHLFDGSGSGWRKSKVGHGRVLVLPKMATIICCMRDTDADAVKRGNTPYIDGCERDVHSFRGKVMPGFCQATICERMGLR